MKKVDDLVGDGVHVFFRESISSLVAESQNWPIPSLIYRRGKDGSTINFAFGIFTRIAVKLADVGSVLSLY